MNSLLRIRTGCWSASSCDKIMENNLNSAKCCAPMFVRIVLGEESMQTIL